MRFYSDIWGRRRYDPEEILWQRLVWTHGAERALEIVNGSDQATNADLAAWRALGKQRAA